MMLFLIGFVVGTAIEIACGAIGETTVVFAGMVFVAAFALSGTAFESIILLFGIDFKAIQVLRIQKACLRFGRELAL